MGGKGEDDAVSSILYRASQRSQRGYMRSRERHSNNSIELHMHGERARGRGCGIKDQCLDALQTYDSDAINCDALEINPSSPL